MNEKPPSELLKGLIKDGWSMRHEYFGVRLVLRSLIIRAKEVRDRRSP